MQESHEITVKQCEYFIRHVFEKMKVVGDTAIEINCFWKKAEEAGLTKKGLMAAPMTDALRNLVDVDDIHNDNGEYLYTVFRLCRYED